MRSAYGSGTGGWVPRGGPSLSEAHSPIPVAYAPVMLPGTLISVARDPRAYTKEKEQMRAAPHLLLYEPSTDKACCTRSTERH